jgi:hypothetical protein
MGSAIFSGGGGASSAALKQAIDGSLDIDAILSNLGDIKAILMANRVTATPQLYPAIVGTANQALETQSIAVPGAGKHLIIQTMGWYDKSPTVGLLEVVGSDGLNYMKVPIVAAGAGFIIKSKLPANIGCVIKLSAGGTGVVGHLNYAIAIEES